MPNSIITVSTPTPPPLQAQAKVLALQQANAFRQVVAVFNATSQFIWSDPTKAQAAFDAFSAAGYKASDLFANAEAAMTLIATLTGSAPASPVPTGWTYTINPDSTVTVTAPQG